MAKGNYKIPFNNGKMMGYADAWDEKQVGFEWRDNYTFIETMEIDTYGRGRSSVTIYLRDENNNRYEMFISDFVEAMQTVFVSDGKFTGEFTFVKKGKNYGVQLVK